ncbi:MAG: TolC family outer membrane protein [Roseovarius sp.]|uniref:TolC family outer membrane protein n=1 Tax=Roseovarius sp. TaxID=1486281 RepID=UPI0032EF46CB
MKIPFRSRVFGAVSAVMIGLVQPLAASAETLADTLVSAYENSGLLEQNRALLRAADEDVAQIVAELRPIINWSADITRTFGTTRSGGITGGADSNELNLGISLDLLLFDFGRTNLRMQAAKETVLATRESLRNIEQQVLLRAVAAYMNVRRTSELVSVRQNNLRLLRQELRAANDRFEVGEVTRTDVALAEARLASAQSGLATAQGDLTQAVEEFRNAVGRDPGQLRAPQSLPNLSGNIEAAKAVAVRNHPDMRKAQYDVAAADLTVAAAEAAMKPSVSLTTRLGVGEEIDGTDYTRSGSVGVTVSGPIYQGGLLSSAKRQAMAQADSLRGALHVARKQVVEDVGNAYAILRAARASRQAGQEQVRAARVAFRGVREEAKLGARTTLDVLDAEQELLDAQAGLISAETDVYIAAYTVLETIGELTAKDLRLNVRTYDPATYYNLVKDAPVPISPQGQKLDRVLRALGKE